MMVPGSGPPTCKIMFLGARPGRDELRLRKPFVGTSGQLLWRLCPVGRDDIHVDNVCQDFSTHNATPTKSEIERILPDLRDRILRVNPNVVVAFGAQALFALTGQDSVDKTRGYFFESTLVPGLKVLPTWHPAHILRGQFERRYILEADIRKALDDADFPEIRRKKRTYYLDPPAREVIDFIHSLKDEVTVDIECPIRIFDVIHCVGLTDSPEYAMCIPFTWSQRLSGEDLREILLLLQHEVFSKKRICGQNIMFDVWRLERFGYRIQNIHFCTMLAHHLLWPEAGTRQKDDFGKDKFAGGHDLNFLAAMYTDLPCYKDEGSTWNEGGKADLQQYWEYNCKDVAGTHEIMLKEQTELREFQQETYFHEHVMPLIRPCLQMQERGMAIDVSALERVKRRLELEREALQLRLNHAVGFELNVKSPPQMRYLIKDVLGMRSFKKTKTGAPSTDEETLKTLAYGSTFAPIFQQVLEVRERRTLVSGFFQLEASEGRYGAPYKVHGTDSGRLSSTSPRDLDGRKGPQLQNVPYVARQIFCATPGYLMICGDYARAEAMYVAYDARDEKLIALFEDPSRDLYMEVAADCLSKPVEEVSRVYERPCFKQVVLGTNYGLGPVRLINTLRKQNINIEDIEVRGITKPRKKAEFFLESYKEKFPRISEWQDYIIDVVKRTRVLHDSFGRRRFFMGSINDPHTENVALSFRPQASIAKMTNTAITRIYQEGRYPLLMQVHDSTGIEAPIPEAEQAADTLRKAMDVPLDMHGRVMRVPVDIQWGFNWGPYHEIDNPGGLRGGRIVVGDVPQVYREA